MAREGNVLMQLMERRCFLKALGITLVPTVSRPIVAAERPREIADDVVAVRDLGVQFRGNDVNITGQDGATSIPLPDGDAFWFFGDTIEGEFDTIRNHDLTHVLSNTAAVVPRQDPADGLEGYEYLQRQGRARQVIEFADDEDPARHRLWPMHGVCIGPHIYVYYHKITMDPEVDVFVDFRLDGMGLARARIGGYRFERLRTATGSREFWRGDEPGFGVYVERGTDGYIYLWGSAMTAMFLARTRPDSIEDLRSYEYLVDGPTAQQPQQPVKWASAFAGTAPRFAAVPNEMSASANAHLGKHLAFHTWHRENKLVMRSAPKVWGPWSNAAVFHRPKILKSDDLFNAGKEHPELAQDGGKRLYMTYVNSSIYLPHLMEVRLG